MRIIPAIDIIDGKCVRLTKGDYKTQKTYSENPVEMAQKFEAAGLEYLHVVDLDGARLGKIVNYKTLEKMAKNTGLKIDFGGGLKTNQDLKIAFESGANQITGGSIAVNDPELFAAWIQKYGAEKIILGADVKDEKIAVSGWSETSKHELIHFIARHQELGITTVICTDISKDGMLEGPSFALYQKILKSFPGLTLIASGGVSNIGELPKLKAIGCEGVIIGKAIYEGRISFQQLEQFNLQS